MKSVASEKRPLASELEAPECACCRHTALSVTPGENVQRDDGYLLAPSSERICSFCKLLFPDVVPTVPDLSDVELLGAWSLLVEDVRFYDTNVSAQMRRHKLDVEQGMSGALRQWVGGSVAEEAGQYDVLQALWPREAFTRVLRLIETAVVLADDLDHCFEVAEVCAAVEDPEVAPVWEAWLGSHYLAGKSLKAGGQTEFFAWGEQHIEKSIEWAGVVAKMKARRLLAGK